MSRLLAAFATALVCSGCFGLLPGTSTEADAGSGGADSGQQDQEDTRGSFNLTYSGSGDQDCARDVVVEDTGGDGLIQLYYRNGQTHLDVVTGDDTTYHVTFSVVLPIRVDAPPTDTALEVAIGDVDEWVTITTCDDGSGQLLAGNGSDNLVIPTRLQASLSGFDGDAPADTEAAYCPVEYPQGCTVTGGYADATVAITFEDNYVPGRTVTLDLDVNAPLTFAGER